MLLIGLDQHRFQPWAYQLFLFVVICAFCDVRYQVTLMRALIVSVYFFSAVGKFDFEFLHSVGQQMLGAMFKLFGQDASSLDNWLRLVLVGTFPLLELVIAVGLAWPRTRRIAGLSAIGLHLSLILILGPLGLNHRLGVLLWNTQFAVQAYLLFVVKDYKYGTAIGDEQTVAPESTGILRKGLHAGCVLVIVMAMVMPMTERFGIWDHWPSWALYAPHSSRVRVEIASESLNRLPAELVALTNRPTNEQDGEPNWVLVPIDAWSLVTLNTPIYPQSRFQLGVAKQIASDVNSEHQVRLSILGAASRFTGLRRSEMLEGAIEIAKSGENYWLNSRPRIVNQIVNQNETKP